MLKLSYKKDNNTKSLVLSAVDKHAVIETHHTGNISDIFIVQKQKMLLTAGEDRKVKIWSFDGDPHGSLHDTRYPVNCISMTQAGLLAIGDCAGGVRIYHIISPSEAVVFVTNIDVAALFVSQIHTEEDQARAGCDVLSLTLKEADTNNEEDVNQDDFYELVSSKVTDEIQSTNQQCLVGTTLGICILNLRSRSISEIIVFSQLVSPSSSVLTSLATIVVVAESATDSSLLAVYQGAMSKSCKLITMPCKQTLDISETGSDTDSGCCIISVEDGEDNHEHDTVISTIPKDEIIRGSLLDLNKKSLEMKKQSITILRKGSLPIEKMKNNIRMWQSSSATSSKPVKSSGYGKDLKKHKMFVPQVHKTKPKLKKNNLFSNSESDISSITPSSTRPSTTDDISVSQDKRQRWSFG